MSWLGRTLRRARSQAQVSRDDRDIDPGVVGHLDDFRQSREGVEGWAEEETSFNPPSLLLVAGSGEYTRRFVPSVEWAHHYGQRHRMPVHPAGVVGYPQRMRDWDRKRTLRPQQFPPDRNDELPPL